MSARLRKALKNKERIVILAGAGMSAESGVPTFRDKEGLWNNYEPHQLATLEAFLADPKLVWEWYLWRRDVIAKCKPNPAHYAVAKIEMQLGNKLNLITQNVDGLHRDAGSKNFLEVHGCIWEVRCIKCGKAGIAKNIPEENLPPKCLCGGLVRPGVVWFGESLPEDILSKSFKASADCEVMIVVGTSGVVYPIAHLPQVAADNESYIIEVNPEQTPISPLAAEIYNKPAGEVLPEIFGLNEEPLNLELKR